MPVDLLEAIKRMTDAYAEKLPPDGDWAPMLFSQDKEGKVALIGLDPEFVSSERMKDYLADQVMPNVLRELKGEPQAVVFLSSTWVVEMAPGDEYVRPSLSPNRKEQLVLLYASSTEEMLARADIVRGGEHPQLEWLEDDDAIGIEGRMIGGLRRAIWQ